MKINDNTYGKRSTLGDYEIVQQCGSGTYGSVYRAIHKNTRQVVALKRVSKFPVEDGFPVECKYLEQLCSSKNVVNMLEYFYTPDGQLVLVFEYMETDLWKLISGPNANVPLLQTKCIMKQLFEGLCQCHSAGIMHRDVKPSNLLINANGILKLADFGLTTSFIKPPYLSNNVVSLFYRPPELLLGSHNYGPEIDMWSAGCILVELLTNDFLFAGSNEADQLDMIFQVFGTPDEDVWPGVSMLPGWGLVESGKQHPIRDLHDNYKFEANVLDLASRLLQLDPKKRITSYEALQHPWFYATPLPCSPSLLTSLWKNAKKAAPVMQAPHPKPPPNHQNGNIWRKDNNNNDFYPVNYDGYYIHPHNGNYHYNNFNNQCYNNYPYDNNYNYNNYYYNNNGYNNYHHHNNVNYHPYYNNPNNYYFNNPDQYNYPPYPPGNNNYNNNYTNDYYNNPGYNAYNHQGGGRPYPAMRRGYMQPIWSTGALNYIYVN